MYGHSYFYLLFHHFGKFKPIGGIPIIIGYRINPDVG